MYTYIYMHPPANIDGRIPVEEAREDLCGEAWA